MRLLHGADAQEAVKYIQHAAEIAKSSPCYRSQCGSVIVNNGEVIGAGFNSPPKNECLEKCLKDELPENFKSDRTCCVHAEQRAMLDAIKTNPDKIEGSTIYFIRLNRGSIAYAGKPYCTICSKMSLDVGISEFVLWHDEGITSYDAKEYNDLSFQHRPE